MPLSQHDNSDLKIQIGAILSLYVIYICKVGLTKRCVGAWQLWALGSNSQLSATNYYQHTAAGQSCGGACRQKAKVDAEATVYALPSRTVHNVVFNI